MKEGNVWIESGLILAFVIGCPWILRWALIIVIEMDKLIGW